MIQFEYVKPNQSNVKYLSPNPAKKLHTFQKAQAPVLTAIKEFFGWFLVTFLLCLPWLV